MGLPLRVLPALRPSTARRPEAIASCVRMRMRTGGQAPGRMAAPVLYPPTFQPCRRRGIELVYPRGQPSPYHGAFPSAVQEPRERNTSAWPAGAQHLSEEAGILVTREKWRGGERLTLLLQPQLHSRERRPVGAKIAPVEVEQCGRGASGSCISGCPAATGGNLVHVALRREQQGVVGLRPHDPERILRLLQESAHLAKLQRL
mmetsp:Transcript_46393/g.99140  ORF Transcript_46393/g.99140 Transcript_46393/m.99140 type:complete len:203 (+) Transcript_46393:40-648(+)